jgi:hypothetical protein
MKDILLPALMVFMSGCLFGLGTMLIMDFYYNKQFEKWKKEREEENDE